MGGRSGDLKEKRHDRELRGVFSPLLLMSSFASGYRFVWQDGVPKKTLGEENPLLFISRDNPSVVLQQRAESRALLI